MSLVTLTLKNVIRTNKCHVRKMDNGKLVTSPVINSLAELRDYIRINCSLTDTGIRLSYMSETEGCEVVLAYFNHYGNVII
ncbi:hypothetical protein PP757_gp89 [Pseudomonas phage vB_PaeP_TUMS_P121]|uniref:Uncharacterized protein n=1 Tax=Pseudomonas phage vB_PaeP_TUMS_P121 TaxID=2873372 RepID=A0AAE8YHL4_9CAUD|nr:hypothetical protein PP757_gp89 [Pseudomonas phage vB_PaeP_TUMS_P121]UEP18721.1 hypothetical protein [Pseudomonas phage vB_PaeP_TUMS_P121]